jgi:hypothetical protein
VEFLFHHGLGFFLHAHLSYSEAWRFHVLGKWAENVNSIHISKPLSLSLRSGFPHILSPAKVVWLGERSEYTFPACRESISLLTSRFNRQEGLFLLKETGRENWREKENVGKENGRTRPVMRKKDDSRRRQA